MTLEPPIYWWCLPIYPYTIHNSIHLRYVCLLIYPSIPSHQISRPPGPPTSPTQRNAALKMDLPERFFFFFSDENPLNKLGESIGQSHDFWRIYVNWFPNSLENPWKTCHEIDIIWAYTGLIPLSNTPIDINLSKHQAVRGFEASNGISSAAMNDHLPLFHFFFQCSCPTCTDVPLLSTTWLLFSQFLHPKATPFAMQQQSVTSQPEFSQAAAVSRERIFGS